MASTMTYAPGHPALFHPPPPFTISVPGSSLGSSRGKSLHRLSKNKSLLLYSRRASHLTKKRSPEMGEGMSS
jgi:hypothetical protein